MRGWISPRASAKDGSYFLPVQNNKCTCKVESARTVPLLLWSKRWKKSERFLDKTGKHKRQSKNLNRPHNNQLEFLLKKKNTIHGWAKKGNNAEAFGLQGKAHQDSLRFSAESEFSLHAGFCIMCIPKGVLCGGHPSSSLQLLTELGAHTHTHTLLHHACSS